MCLDSHKDKWIGSRSVGIYTVLYYIFERIDAGQSMYVMQSLIWS